MPDYVYELRRNDQVVATGKLSDERRFDVGDELEIAGWVGIVRDQLPSTNGEIRLIVQVRRRNPTDS